MTPTTTTRKRKPDPPIAPRGKAFAVSRLSQVLAGDVVVLPGRWCNRAEADSVRARIDARLNPLVVLVEQPRSRP